MCSLNWQHQLCKNPRPNPDIKTLFTDHTCSPPNGARASPVSVPLAAVPKAGAAYPPLTAHTVCLHLIIFCSCMDFMMFFYIMYLFMQPFQPPPPGPSLAGWMANAAASSSVQSAVVAAASIPVPPNQGMQMWC
jgi:hypothetical protein